MSRTMKKKLAIIGIIVFGILAFIGNAIINSQPHLTSEQRETQEDIEEDMANETATVTTRMESEDRTYQITLNNYLVTLGRSTLREICTNTGVLDDSLKISEWNYHSRVEKVNDAESDVTEEVINEGYAKISVMNNSTEELWFLVKAYATEMPGDIMDCVVWGIGVNSNSNYVLQNTKINAAMTYAEIVEAFGEPLTSTHTVSVAEEPSEEAVQPTEDTLLIDETEETPTEEVEPITEESQTWEAEWRTEEIALTIRQLENYRTTYIELL